MTEPDKITRGELPSRVAAIEELGVVVGHEEEWVGEVGAGRHPVLLLETVRGVQAPLTPEEWLSIAQREGNDYMGGCCANMSAVQDEISGVFRNGGWIDADEFLRIGEGMRRHDGTDETFRVMDDEDFEKQLARWREVGDQPLAWKATEEDVARFAEKGYELEVGQGLRRNFGPWEKLAVVYNAVEPYLKPSSTDVPKNRLSHQTEDSHIVSQLADEFFRMDWNDVVTRSDEEQGQHQANRLVTRARIYPLMQRLLEVIEREGVDFNGFAIVKQGTNEVLSNMHGPCIYSGREEAERVTELWARLDAEERKRYEESKARGDNVNEEILRESAQSEIVHVTVTLEEGLKVHR